MARATWYRLDNIGKFYSSQAGSAAQTVFRYAATLADDVDPVLLQCALEKTVDVFPGFNVCLRSGMFWHYLEQATTVPAVTREVLPICFGPATRLGAYLTGHDKAYRATIAFGVGTDTDDCEGTVTRTGEAPVEVGDRSFAEQAVEQMLGQQKQMPPAYSAIKVNGKKSYEAAREGHIIELSPRDIEVYSAKLIAVRPGVGEQLPEWDVEFRVSKGTYIRALARDLGHKIGCPAHLAALRRLEVGGLTLDECVPLEALEELKLRAALDPVRLLGVRFAYVEGAAAQAVGNGNVLRAADCQLFERRRTTAQAEMCACTAGVRESTQAPQEGEVIAVISQNKVVALYQYDSKRASFKACCVFQTGVLRGADL